LENTRLPGYQNFNRLTAIGSLAESLTFFIMIKLTRNELKGVIGGYAPPVVALCSVYCGSTRATCSGGTYCEATDGVGCTSYEAGPGGENEVVDIFLCDLNVPAG
jgi:hypothetical protein